MTSRVKPIPDGYHSITPYMIFSDAARAIEFYRQAFGAAESMRLAAPGGKIGHAEITIGDSAIMLADEYPEMGAVSAQSLGGSPISIMLYVEDVDALMAQAVAGGTSLTRPIENKFYGDRAGTVQDPFGYSWTIATHIEDVPPEELKKQVAAMYGDP